MAGIEKHWRHSTQTEIHENINPIGDMDLDKLAEESLVNDKLRELTSLIGRTEPASYTNYMTSYHSETHE